MSKITDQIWIGSYADLCNKQFLEKNSITHILCCAREFHELPENLEKDKYTYYRIPIVEKHVGSQKFKKWFRKGASKLNEWLLHGHKVLVHCYQGISRSDSIVLSYFILYKGLSFREAYQKVKIHRHRIHPYEDFIPVLKGLEGPGKKTRRLK